MSTFDDASLVMIPSGYKPSKIYSVKPTDGTGDLTFTRSLDTATRVGPDGLIEKVRTNLLLHSQDPSNAVWQKTNTTYSGNTLTAVGGLNTKFLVQAQATQGLQNIYFDVEYTNHAFFQIILGNSVGDVHFANFDIQNKVLGTSGGGIINATIQDFGTFVRIAMSSIQTGKISCVLAFVDSASAARGASSTSTGSVKVFNAQNQTGDIATPYIPTTTAAVSVGMLANVPRLDYLGGGCPKLLLEPQRTNLVTFSEQIDNGQWVKTTGGTGIAPIVTANAGTSPDGTQNADRVQFNCVGTTTSDRSILRQSISVSNSTAYTFTFYLKAYSSGEIGKELNIRAESITGNPNITLTADWQRISVTGTSSATSTLLIIETRGSVTANTTADVLIWGCQFEAAAYATSYIPTLGAAVTRSADAASKTGISALIGQTEGTLFVDMNYTNNANTLDATPIRIFGSGSAQIYVEINTNDTFEIVLVNSVGTLVYNVTSAAQSVGRKKLAIAYKDSDFAYYINGTQISVQASGAFASASLTSLNLGMYSSGNQVLADTINQALLFPTRLTNAQLEELTA